MYEHLSIVYSHPHLLCMRSRVVAMCSTAFWQSQSTPDVISKQGTEDQNPHSGCFPAGQTPACVLQGLENRDRNANNLQAEIRWDLEEVNQIKMPHTGLEFS